MNRLSSVANTTKNMKHIGIVNITTVGACLCANEIVAQAAKLDPTGKHPEFTMHAFPYDQYRDSILRKDWFTLSTKICQSIQLLGKAGADFIIIPSNTPHFAIDLIQKTSSLPVVNLIHIVADECQRRGFSKVLILGTKLTMQGQLYQTVLNSKNIMSIIPSDDECDQIEHLIRNELIPSKFNSTTINDIKNDIQKYECDAVILACTELPLVYNEENLKKPVIDTTRFLAQHALRLASGT
jgi:aspartate racemase